MRDSRKNKQYFEDFKEDILADIEDDMDYLEKPRISVLRQQSISLGIYLLTISIWLGYLIPKGLGFLIC
jgi:hypothetical protein